MKLTRLPPQDRSPAVCPPHSHPNKPLSTHGVVLVQRFDCTSFKFVLSMYCSYLLSALGGGDYAEPVRMTKVIYLSFRKLRSFVFFFKLAVIFLTAYAQF